jgi:hypothetical protein
MEHRWGQRVDAVIAVRLRPLIDLCERDAHLTNLSASGGFTPARLGVRKFSRIQVVFDLPELLGQSPQEVSAYVARESHAGTGLEWCEHSSLTIVRLLRFFSQSTPGLANQTCECSAALQRIHSAQSAAATGRLK